MNNKVYNKALEVFGYKSQIVKAIEELAELQTALAKKLNNIDYDDALVIDEIADVSIMIDQLSIIFGVEKIQCRTQFKIQRLAEIVRCQIQ